MPSPEVIPFICYIHEFTTEDPETFYKHLADVQHEKQGSFVCTGCNHSSKFTPGKLIKEGYDEKQKPNLVPKNQLCKNCQDSEDKEIIKRLKKEKKI